jgi:uroporphyrinogen-III synthase
MAVASVALWAIAPRDSIPDAELDPLAALGFDWIWFLSVWAVKSLYENIAPANIQK